MLDWDYVLGGLLWGRKEMARKMKRAKSMQNKYVHDEKFLFMLGTEKKYYGMRDAMKQGACLRKDYVGDGKNL